MFITIQFPISDLRYFSVIDTGKIHKPVWPNPISEQEFIRSFGAVIERNLGGLSGWIGESYICTANQAIKFKNLHHPIYIDDKRISLIHIFRRVYFDGLTTGKFEIGLSIILECKVDNRYERVFIFSKKIISLIINHILGFPVWVSRNKYPDNKENNLINIGKSLASYFLSCTTYNTFPQKQVKDWWVNAGQPILYLESLPKEKISIPYYCRSQIENSDFGKLSNFRVMFKNCKYPLWIMEPNPNCPVDKSFEQKQFLRKVRILIMRAHAEKNSLLYTLCRIVEPQIKISSNLPLLEKYQAYLNEATKRISAIERQSKKIFDTDEASFLTNTNELVDSTFNSQILYQIEGIRKNIIIKIKNFLEKNKVVNNITVFYNNNGDIQEDTIDVDHLVHELIQIRAKLSSRTNTIQEEEVIKSLTSAEKEAKKGNGKAMLTFLSKAGKIAYDIAVDIGASLIINLITQAVKLG